MIKLTKINGEVMYFRITEIMSLSPNPNNNNKTVYIEVPRGVIETAENIHELANRIREAEAGNWI